MGDLSLYHRRLNVMGRLFMIASHIEVPNKESRPMSILFVGCSAAATIIFVLVIQAETIIQKVCMLNSAHDSTCGENLLLIYAYLLFMPFILFLLP